MGGVRAPSSGSRPGPVAAERPPAGGRPRRALVAAVLVATAVVVVANRGELPAAWHALRHVRVAWFLAAVGLAVVGFVDLGAEHAGAQRAVGLRPRFGAVLPLALAARFLNIVAKSGGLAGVGVFRSAARRAGRPEGPVTAAYLLTAVLDPLAFALLLAVAFGVLVVEGRFTAADAAATAVFAGYLAVTVGALALALRSRSAVRALYALPSRIRRRPPPGPERADELYDAAALLRREGRAVAAPALAALGVDLVGVAELWVVLAAVDVRVGVSVALVAYAVSTLFGIVGVVPGGLGFVEVSLGAVLVSYGVAVGVAGAAVVLYRLVELWIPLGVGAVAAHRVATQ